MSPIDKYLKRIAEKLTKKTYKKQHTTSYYLNEISNNWSSGGGGSYDDTELRNRITAVESGKQDKLTAGQNITIAGNTITAREIINDTINSPTTVWSSNKVKSLIEALQGGVDISIVATRPDPSAAIEKTIYYVGSSAPYHIWFFLDDEYNDFGTTEINLENYYTKSEVNDLLNDKVDKVTGKSLVLDTDIAQITTNKNDIASLDTNKVDKETGKSLILTTDITQITTNKNNIESLDEEKQDEITSSVQSSNPTDSDSLSDLNGTTNKRWTFSKIWAWIIGKLSTSISSDSTDEEIPSASAVWKMVNTASMNYSNMTSLDDIFDTLGVPNAGTKHGYITNLSPVQSAGAAKAAGYVRASQTNANYRMLEFYSWSDGIRWSIIKNNGTWGSWKPDKQYVHRFVYYNTTSFDHPLCWWEVINNEPSYTVEKFKTFLTDAGHTTQSNSYVVGAGGMSTTTTVSTPSGTGIVGNVFTGAYMDGTALKFKQNYSGVLTPNESKIKITTTEL